MGDASQNLSGGLSFCRGGTGPLFAWLSLKRPGQNVFQVHPAWRGKGHAGPQLVNQDGCRSVLLGCGVEGSRPRQEWSRDARPERVLPRTHFSPGLCPTVRFCCDSSLLDRLTRSQASCFVPHAGAKGRQSSRLRTLLTLPHTRPSEGSEPLRCVPC